MSLGTRLMNAVVNVLTAILNIRIRFKYVLLAFIIFVGGAIGITYKHMLDLVGVFILYAAVVRGDDSRVDAELGKRLRERAHNVRQPAGL